MKEKDDRANQLFDFLTQLGMSVKGLKHFTINANPDGEMMLTAYYSLGFVSAEDKGDTSDA